MSFLARILKPQFTVEYCNGAEELAKRLLEDADVDTLSRVRVKEHLTRS